MIINGQQFHTIWVDNNKPDTVKIINQLKLPFNFNIKPLKSFDDAFNAIKNMEVRGAPLIGVCAAYGIWLALIEKNDNVGLQEYINNKCLKMKQARPTAINLAYAVNISQSTLQNVTVLTTARKIALMKANELKQAEIDRCEQIGEYGLKIIEEIALSKPGEPVSILTHCNAGWLACVDWGTATAPIYKAHQKGIKLHVWVDETRPLNQGSKLTAFELLQEGVPHTVITDNTGGHLMQHGLVDMVIVGSDRTTRTGDVCNKIGTYLKALAAHDNNIPFYVALPSSSIDFSITNGLNEIPIEQRDADEVIFVEGKEGKTRVVPIGSPVANYVFDVTPARLVTALITEKGICRASEAAISEMFPQK